jgi:NAD(P)-dependent dehydrogenase (short-subunit alcohol dehydrogenase family)
VTGASGGIGFQIASEFLDRGAVVGAHYRSDRARAERLMEQARPGQCRIFQADFSRSGEVLRLWDEFINWTGGIDVLVNNAGEAPTPVPLHQLKEETWDTAFQVNAKAPFLLGRAALAAMAPQRSGRIINVSSIGVKFGGGATTVHYSASKAALEALTMSFAKAGAPYDVLVNTVRAGVTDTAFHEKIGRIDLSDRVALIPLKRLAHTAEISAAVLFLASDQSTYVTGTVLTVAGGE